MSGTGSWGHAVRPLADDELAGWALAFASGCGMRKNRQRCGCAITHTQTYNYVTGRGGRVSTSTRGVCAEHARRFAEKHGVDSTVMGGAA